ncbi:MAG: hypothetical protein ABIF77_06040, partial [bacterium]
MTRTASLLLTAILLTVMPLIATGATIRVDVAGSGDFLTIQEGLDNAAGCDTVLVAPGTYTGPLNRNLSFGLLNLVLLSEAGLGGTVIDAEGQDRVFDFNGTGQDTTSIIRGFTIQNGYTD